MRIGGGPVDLPLVVSLLDSCPDGVLAVDDAGVIRFVNARVEILFGWTRAALVGRPLSDLIPATMRDTHGDLFASYLAAPSARPMNAGQAVIGLHRDGRRLALQVALSPVHSAQGLHVAAWIREHGTVRAPSGDGLLPGKELL